MIEHLSQPGILAPALPFGCSMTLRLLPEASPRESLLRLCDEFDPEWGIIGIGEPLARRLERSVPGLRSFLALSGPGYAVPSTQQALWIFLRARDRGAIFDHAERLKAELERAFALEDAQDTFLYADGRDLTGYLDGTENPTGEKGIAAALVAAGDGMQGSSFAAVQRWVHDLRHFNAHSRAECDAMIGRRRDSNEEIEDAPPSAHVKRSAQESFEPEAFMIRRSMPWAGAREAGLEFIAYGRSLDAFERVLRRMAGLEDGIVDALFRFSRPVTGGYYWCPPIAAGRIDTGFLG